MKLTRRTIQQWQIRMMFKEYVPLTSDEERRLVEDVSYWSNYYAVVGAVIAAGTVACMLAFVLVLIAIT